MPESFDAINHQNRDVEAVAGKQFGVALNIDLLQFVQLGAISFRHFGLHHFTKVATGFAVQDDLNVILHSHRQFLRWLNLLLPILS